MTKRGRVIWSYVGVYNFMSLCLCTLLFGLVVFVFWTCSICVLDMYFVVWILSCCWHEPMYGLLLFIFWSYVSLLWLIFDTYLLCVVCGVFLFLCILLYTIHLPRVLEVGGNCLCIPFHNSVIFICIDGLHRAYLIYHIHMLFLMHLAYMTHLIYACV